jgi:hypothetical protein
MARSAEGWAEQHQGVWRGHRVVAGVLRLAVFLCPLTAAGALGVLASRSIPGAAVGAVVVRAALTAAVSVAGFLAVERGARRFLPLAALLRLNLVFPDRAPSRFSVALRSSSVRRLERLVREARRSDDAVALAEKVVTLAAALNTHDRRTRGHCERTRALADLIIDELHLSPREANEVRWGAFLHDVGKLVVPAEILNKPGKPTTREWEILRSHPEAGARLVEPLRAFLHSGVDAVGSHHENFDGSGYPCGLKGDRLPLAARIVSVADSFEVMTAVRAYKRPMSLQAARAELACRSGTQFDPHVVRAFLNVSLGRLHWTVGIAAWIAELPFLTLIPRVAAQLAPAGAATPVSQIALPGLAAASLGAMSVVPHLQTPTAVRSSPPVTATAPDRRGSTNESTPPAVPARSATTTASTLPDASTGPREEGETALDDVGVAIPAIPGASGTTTTAPQPSVTTAVDPAGAVSLALPKTVSDVSGLVPPPSGLGATVRAARRAAQSLGKGQAGKGLLGSLSVPTDLSSVLGAVDDATGSSN